MKSTYRSRVYTDRPAYNATWGDLADMYKHAREYDPNFLPSKEMERIVARLDKDKIGRMDVDALRDLYQAAVGIRTEFYNRRSVLNDQEHRLFSEIYAQSKEEIENAPGGYRGGKLRKLLDLDQLSAMNALERMGGWDPDGAFYSMAKQLERGELDAQDYQVRANRLLEEFLTENRDWARTADGQGKDAVWYEVEVPELLELGKGDKPIFGDTVKVYMTPAQKVHMYLESKNYDNLRHMAGGRTFVNRELYARGRRQEAFAQGVTVRLAPETVKKLVADLTPQEQALADALDGYYNRFAPERINRVSNALYGFDKTIGGSYAPIFSNQNYTKTEFGLFDTTPEGVGSLKARQYSKNPSYNISAFDAFEQNVGQASRFVGYAIPKRNFETLLDWRGRETGKSMRDVIAHKWGGEGTEYIDTLCNRLFSGTSTEKDTVSEGVEKLWSNYISATFGANPSIVLKQLGSIPLASAYLGVSNVPNPIQAAKMDRDLVNKYTSVLAWRGMGYATPETRQIKDNPNWTQTNMFVKTVFGGGAITAVDQGAAGVLWPWAENKVCREFPELEVGTQEQIDAGQSPFYRKVAEEFENAVVRSQSTSDETHQGTLRKSKNLATRTLTMFKSDSSQSYNALRQAIGEARHYKRAGDAENARKARRAAGAAFMATVGGNLWAAGVTALLAMWKRRDKRYRDEEGELTVESVAQKVFKDMLSGLGGLTVGGEELVEFIGDRIAGDTWYGIEVPGLEQINDLAETLAENAGSWAKALAGAKDVLDNGGDVPEYLRRHGNDILGGIKEVAQTVATYFPGLPVNNLEAYIVGTVRHVSPALGTAYDDLWATADKSGLKGLTGDALRVRMGDVLAGRLGEADEDAVEALSALYEAGYTGAAPGDTPGKISVDGEERTLTAFQQQFYDEVWKDVVGGQLDGLVKSRAFQTGSLKDREKLLKKLYTYGQERAKEELFEDYESTSSAERFLDAGLDQSSAVSAALAVDSLEPQEGKSTVSAAEKAQAVARMDLSDRQTDAAVGVLLDGDALSDYEAARQAGLDPETYLSWKLQIAWYQSVKDESGKTAVSKQDQVVESIDEMDLTREQKDALYLTQYTEAKLDEMPWN